MSTESNPIRANLQKQVSTRATFPEGHVIGICYARIFGYRHAATPEGHPILISSGVFDNTMETALSAIKRAAYRWSGIVQSADGDWLCDLDEDVIQPANGPKIGYSKLYHFVYLPEQPIWEHLGIAGKVSQPFQRLPLCDEEAPATWMIHQLAERCSQTNR